MALTAFTCRLGESQGRLPAAGSANDYVLVLGDQSPGRFAHLVAGDHVEVAQDADLSDVALICANLELTVPKSVPAGLTWSASILIDDAPVACAEGRPGQVRAIADLAANVARLKGVHRVALRLELTSTEAAP